MTRGPLFIPILLKQPEDGTPYQPSNGTEGEGFTEGLCAHCKRDRAFRRNPDAEEGCDILSRTMAFSIGDAEYPKEWIWKGGEPTCTAFDDVVLRITNEERAAQMELL